MFDALTYKSYLDMQIKSIKGWNFSLDIQNKLWVHLNTISPYRQDISKDVMCASALTTSDGGGASNHNF